MSIEASRISRQDSPKQHLVSHPATEGKSRQQHHEVPQAASEQTVRRFQQVVKLWLRWNQRYERMTEDMFQARHDQAKVVALADEVDTLRQQAVAMSQELIGCLENR